MVVRSKILLPAVLVLSACGGKSQDSRPAAVSLDQFNLLLIKKTDF
jgi:hypothetical protein